MNEIKQNSPYAWFLAARPKTLTGAIIPVLLGSALAFSDGQFKTAPALLCALFACGMQIAANFINDLFDFQKGTDRREDRLGPQRACAEGPVQVQVSVNLAPEKHARAHPDVKSREKRGIDGAPVAAVRHVQLHGLEGGDEDAEAEADEDGGGIIDPFQRRKRQRAEADSQDAQRDDGKFRHAPAVDLPAHHEPGDQHAQPHQRIKQPGILETVHFPVQGGIHSHNAVGEGGDHHIHRQRNAHAQHQAVQHLFGRFIHGLLNGAPGGADEGGDARPSQAQDQGAPRNHVKTVLLVYLEADDGSQAHAQRHRHAEKAQALPAAGRYPRPSSDRRWSCRPRSGPAQSASGKTPGRWRPRHTLKRTGPAGCKP